MILREYNNFNSAYRDIVTIIKLFGKESSPRGMKIKELLGYSFILNNPSKSLCTLKSRKLNYKFATIERLEYLSGNSSGSRLVHYNKNMNNFLNENGNFDGAYAPRIGRQLEYIYTLLKKDPDTRQAIININSEVDKRETKDVPCTVSLQFFIRENKLSLIVYMRSNDLLWGTPYDVSAFCYIQLCLAYWLGIKVGYYQHFAGSLHYYLEREKQLLNIFKDKEENNEVMNIVDFPFEHRNIHFYNFWKEEELIRNKKKTKIEDIPKSLQKDLIRIK